MQHYELQAGSLGRLTGRDIVAAMVIAAIALLLAPVVGLVVLLIG